MRTLISPIVYKNANSNTVRLIKTIGETAGKEYILGSPVSDNSYSYQANLAIKMAASIDCEFVMFLDNDTYFNDKMQGWLTRLETAMDKYQHYGLFLQGDQSDLNNNVPVFANELQSTPYTNFCYAFYRISTNILFDTDFIFFQSSDCDLIREMRRQKWLTGCLRSVTVEHDMKPHIDSARNIPYERIKNRNERLFNEKYNGAICHIEPTPEQWAIRDKWRGIYGRTDIDNLQDYSNQYLSIQQYIGSPFYENDINYIIRNNLKLEDYYSKEEIENVHKNLIGL